MNTNNMKCTWLALGVTQFLGLALGNVNGSIAVEYRLNILYEWIDMGKSYCLVHYMCFYLTYEGRCQHLSASEAKLVLTSLLYP